MKNALGFCAVAMLLALAACKDTDNAAKWVGIYKQVAGGTGSVNQVEVQENNSNTIRLLADTVLATPVNGISVFTRATFQSVKLQSANTGLIDEDIMITGSTKTFHAVGTATLNGTSLQIVGTAVSTDSSQVLGLNFAGTKQ